MEKRAQASADFMIVVGVLLILAVLLAAFLMSNSGNIDLRARESKVYWGKAAPFSILDAKALKNGLRLVVKNTASRLVYLKSVTVRDKLLSYANQTNYSSPLGFESGQQRDLNIPLSYAQTGPYCQIALKFGYSDGGLEKQEIGLEDLIIPCSFGCSEFGEYCSEQDDCCEGTCSSNICSCLGLGLGCSSSSECCNANCDIPQLSSPPLACCQGNSQSCGSDADCCRGLSCSLGVCRGSGPDLEITGYSTTDSATGLPASEFYDGNTYQVTYEVLNSGTQPATGPIQHRSSDTPSCGAFNQETKSGGTIQPAQSAQVGPFSVPCPASSACNQTTRAQSALADSGFAVSELDETDNTYDFTLQCLCRPGGMACLANPQCCSGECNSGTCTAPIPPCLGTGEECSPLAPLCCSGLLCDSGQAPPVCNTCISNGGGPCGGDTDCCSGLYCSQVNSTCTTCRDLGETCSPIYPCCSNLACLSGLCRAPDLTVSAPGIELSMEVGKQYPITVQTSNIGNLAAANATVTRVRWNGTAIANISVPAGLGAGVSSTSQLQINCTSPGVKQLVLDADANSNLSEYREDNNNAAYSIVCYCSPCSTYSPVYVSSQASGNPNWMPFRSFTLDITTAQNASLDALWFTDIQLADYGQIYLNGNWQAYDWRPGPSYQSSCANYVIDGPNYTNPLHLDTSFGGTNRLRFDPVNFCTGFTGMQIKVNYNLTLIPDSGSCGCPQTPGNAIIFSDLYQEEACSPSGEESAQCASGICSLDGGCTECKAFPSTCSSDSECCNNKCESYGGTMRCAYSPSKQGGFCKGVYTNKDGMCVKKCTVPADCPAPLVCAGGGCRLGCTTDPQCGSYTTDCEDNYCEYD